MLKMSSSSPSIEKTWFQDSKTGCEKQAHYFVQIRKLQDELIHREQHNLINAMERLKQLTYPRKRPMVRNVDASNPTTVQKFPARNLNLRKEAKHRAVPGKGKPELSSVSGKPLISKPEYKKQDNFNLHHFLMMPPVLSDRDIAKIVHHANATFPSQSSTYFLQPHLPSIPNVGRKTTFMVDNRLKLLTLAEPEFCEAEEGSVSGSKKNLHAEKSRQRKKSPKSKMRLDGYASKANLSKKSSGNVLTFDVDPNDPSLFCHCMSDNKEVQYETTPLPPPNSRPNSKSSQVLLEIAVQDGNSQPRTLKDSGTVNQESDAVSKDTLATTVNEDINVAASVKVEMNDPTLEESNIDIVNSDGDQISDVKDIPVASTEGTQDSSENISDNTALDDNQEQVEIVVPAVTITNKPATSEEDEINQEN